MTQLQHCTLGQVRAAKESFEKEGIFAPTPIQVSIRVAQLKEQGYDFENRDHSEEVVKALINFKMAGHALRELEKKQKHYSKKRRWLRGSKR